MCRFIPGYPHPRAATTIPLTEWAKTSATFGSAWCTTEAYRQRWEPQAETGATGMLWTFVPHFLQVGTRIHPRHHYTNTTQHKLQSLKIYIRTGADVSVYLFIHLKIATKCTLIFCTLPATSLNQMEPVMMILLDCAREAFTLRAYL